MDKYEVAQILREIGMIIEMTDPNPKKGIAYRRAARTVESIPDLETCVKEQCLEDFPGIGKSISQMVTTLMKKGSLPYYEELKNKIPLDLLDLTQISGLTPAKIRALRERFPITNIEDLKQALSDENTRKIKGFGPSFIKKTLDRIAEHHVEGHSLLYPQALSIAQNFTDIFQIFTNKITIAGQLRRKLEMITEIDFIATANDADKCLSLFVKHGLVKEVLFKDSNKAKVKLKQGLIANMQVVNESEYGSALFNITGNKAHLKDLKREANRIGQTWTGEKKFKDENEIYQTLKLPYIVPELREGYGEVKAAQQGKLPHLIEDNDLRGTFHCHTTDSDGSNTVSEMADAAKALGWEYIGISDHSKATYQANGMSEDRLLEQVALIRKLNAHMDGSFQIFAGIECDILKDGQLDFSDEILKQLDFVIVSIHRRFNLEKKEMTQRLIKAIENPYTTMVGHLTGRLLRHRDPYPLDIPKILDACVANNKIIELNAYPSRLDMDWRLWIKAKEKGIKCAINPDAHSIKDLMHCQMGINMARKGWLEKKDVINTFSLAAMKKFLKSRQEAIYHSF